MNRKNGIVACLILLLGLLSNCASNSRASLSEKTPSRQKNGKQDQPKVNVAEWKRLNKLRDSDRTRANAQKKQLNVKGLNVDDYTLGDSDPELAKEINETRFSYGFEMP